MVVDPHDWLAVTLVDLRANIEAKQRALDATEECIAAFRTTGNMKSLDEAARHIRTIGELHTAIGETVNAATVAVQSLLSSGPPSMVVALAVCVVPL